MQLFPFKKLRSVPAILAVALVILAACTPTAAPPAAPTPDDNGGGALQPAPETAVPPQPQEGYPAAPLPSEPLAPGYPAQPPAIIPGQSAYPGEGVWILRPLGIQCEDETQPGYADLDETVETLTNAGITVLASEETYLMVAAMCGAPTSAHYRVQIDPADLDQALAMGWTRES
jgi:hypothetical protein